MPRLETIRAWTQRLRRLWAQQLLRIKERAERKQKDQKN
jgi:hypothetical protein